MRDMELLVAPNLRRNPALSAALPAADEQAPAEESLPSEESLPAVASSPAVARAAPASSAVLRVQPSGGQPLAALQLAGAAHAPIMAALAPEAGISPTQLAALGWRDGALVRIRASERTLQIMNDPAEPPPEVLPALVRLRCDPTAAAQHVKLPRSLREGICCPPGARAVLTLVTQRAAGFLRVPRLLRLHADGPRASEGDAQQPPAASRAGAAAPGGATQRLESAADIVASLPDAHRAALKSSGWDGTVPFRFFAPAPSPGPEAQQELPLNKAAHRLLSAWVAAHTSTGEESTTLLASASPLSSTAGSSLSGSEESLPLAAASRLEGASQQRGVPVYEGMTIRFLSTKGASPGNGQVASEAGAGQLQLGTFTLKLEPGEGLLTAASLEPPTDAAPLLATAGTAASRSDAAATARPPLVILGSMLPRERLLEGEENPWPELPAPDEDEQFSVTEAGGALAGMPWASEVADEALSRLRALLRGVRRSFLSASGTPVLLNASSSAAILTEHEPSPASAGFPAPGGVLLHGPPGVGRTALACAIGRSLSSDPDALAFVAGISCGELAAEEPSIVRGALEAAFAQARLSPV